jgi:hypothetical protein
MEKIVTDHLLLLLLVLYCVIGTFDWMTLNKL